MKDMSLKENTKFPIAVVFYILSVLYSAVNIVVMFTQLYREYNRRVALGGVFGSCLNLILPLVIILLLFLKKRNVLLFLALGLQAVFSAVSAVGELIRGQRVDLIELSYMRSSMYGMSKVIGIILCVAALLFAVDCVCSVVKPYNLFLKKIWFLPIPLYALSAICITLSGAGLMALNTLIPGVLSCAGAAALDWWITRPYKNGYVPAKQLPIQQAYFAPNAPYGAPVPPPQIPVQQPYSAPNMPYTAPVPAAQPAPQAQPEPPVCPQCGRPVTAGNAFCTHCGAPIRTPAQPVNTAPIQSGGAIPVGDSALQNRR